MHGGCGIGVLFEGAGTRGTITDCEIWGNHLPGVTAQLGSDPVIADCKCAGREGVSASCSPSDPDPPF